MLNFHASYLLANNDTSDEILSILSSFKEEWKGHNITEESFQEKLMRNPNILPILFMLLVGMVIVALYVEVADLIYKTECLDRKVQQLEYHREYMHNKIAILEKERNKKDR